MIKAVVFDLFETLITEWVSCKYLSSHCARDLGMDAHQFKALWEHYSTHLTTGKMPYHQVMLSICRDAGVPPDEPLLAACEAKRIAGKNECFDQIEPEVIQMLSALKQKGCWLALCSNCSAEEVSRFFTSPLFPYFDSVVLSYQCGLKKPDREIYSCSAESLSLLPEECLFVGDGGSHELYGAQAAGMQPLRALWFPEKYHPSVQEMPFPAAHTPQEVLAYLNSL